MKHWMIVLAMGPLALLVACSSSAKGPAICAAARAEPRARRAFEPLLGERWIGNGVSYGPHRDGQSPMGASPSKEELHEDLRIMQRHWGLLRMYGSRGPAETVLQLIRDEGLAMKVMVGAWIAPEARLAEDGTVMETYPEAVAANRGEVGTAIRLANAYPDIVLAVNVGNETQVSWSFHKVQTDVLLDYIRQVRAQVRVPVTTADDFSYWQEPASKVVADEVDFIVMHVYPLWCRQPLENALTFTKEQHAVVSRVHADHQIVIGEAGWPTRKPSEGEQALSVVGVAGEAEQHEYYDQFIAWTTKERIPNFYFEAFDENWKGSDDPDEVEKHWGLYRADRTPKMALQGR